MSEVELEFYFTHVYNEVKKHSQKCFTGNIEFKFNFKEGKVINVNASYGKSLKYPNEVLA